MVEICLRGAANMHPVDIELELDAVNYQDATAFGLSRIDQTVSSRMATYNQPAGFLAATFPATVANESTVAARASQTSVDGKPTLAQIEASTVLAREATVAQLDAVVQNVKDDTTALIIAVGSVLARIGVFTGTGVNTILGFFRALMRKDGSITTPSDVGGAFVHTNDSLEAIRDRGDAAWTSGGGSGGVTNITVEDRSITLD
jgi:hypothetical protein